MVSTALSRVRSRLGAHGPARPHTTAPRRALRRREQPHAPRPRARKVESRPVMTRGQRVVFAALTVLWLGVTLGFWAWWLQPSQVGTPVLYAIATACLAYLTTFLPSFYWFFVARMRRPVHQAPSAGRRVAMITLCVPSMESLDVIEAQLRALRAVRHPHDSWILDEGDDPDVRRLAARHGVRYFTRKDVPRWNEPRPPFQAKTKAGNVNAWLDHVETLGIDYDVFVQMDIDHTPRPEYLERTLGYFDDPEVAWVQAPSVASNLDSWTARGLAEQDVVLQGPLQMGFYGHSRTPFIIGSHTSYRTSAVRAIGGFQPTRAEDHLDTVVLAAHGFTGVYVPEIIAEGDGPEGLGTYMGQQFAWAYSMVQIFLHHTPRLVRRYTPGQAFQFLMAQSWYTLWSLSIALLWVLPLVALLSGLPIGAMDLVDFLVRYLAVLLTSTLMWWWTRRWFQPAGVNLTWRGVLLEIARWPIVLYAVVNVLLRVQRPYMITPKGEHAGRPASGRRLYGLHLALAWLALGAIGVFVLAIGASPTAGYVVLTLGNVLMVLALVVTTLGLELRDLRARLGAGAALRLRAGSIGASAVTALAALGAAAAVWPFIVGAL